MSTNHKASPEDIFSETRQRLLDGELGYDDAQNWLREKHRKHVCILWSVKIKSFYGEFCDMGLGTVTSYKINSKIVFSDDYDLLLFDCIDYVLSLTKK